MNKLLKFFGLYVGYLLLTIFFFYIFGLYVWNQPPTKIVLLRMLGLPLILTIVTLLFIICVNKLKK